MIRCLHCRAETTNGLALCDLCQRAAATCLEFLPIYFRNLARQRRPGRPNGSLGTDGQWLIVQGETEGSKVQAQLAITMNDVTTWARDLENDRDIETPESAETEWETIALVCAFLDTHLTSIATLEWAGEFVRDVTRRESALRELTETVVPGWYAGRCRQVTGRSMEGDLFTCGVDTFVVPGLTWVTCVSCGVTTSARDHLDAVLDEAADWVARPKLLAETLVALMDSEASAPRLYDRIRKWESLGWLTGIRRADAEGDPIGAKMYRLGDVFALATGRADAQTRPMRMTSA